MRNAQENATHIILNMSDPNFVMFSAPAVPGRRGWKSRLFDSTVLHFSIGANITVFQSKQTICVVVCFRHVTHHKSF